LQFLGGYILAFQDNYLTNCFIFEKGSPAGVGALAYVFGYGQGSCTATLTVPSAKFWDGGAVTRLWAGIWEDVKPHLLTKTKKGMDEETIHKSRPGELSWRTCFDKFYEAKVFEMVGVTRKKMN